MAKSRARDEAVEAEEHDHDHDEEEAVIEPADTESSAATEEAVAEPAEGSEIVSESGEEE